MQMNLFSHRALPTYLSVAGICAALVLGISPASAQMYQGAQLVKAGLIADTTAILPGETFTVGLRLRMAPHWHTYWENSGDAGLPTTIAWELPAGFKPGPIEWPVPEKIESPGDIVNYGYNNEVVLLTKITAPENLPSGSVMIKAKVDWLVCADLCVPGTAQLALKLGVRDRASEIPSSNPAPAGPITDREKSAEVSRYRELLPKPPGAGSQPIEVKRRVEGQDLILDIKLKLDRADLQGDWGLDDPAASKRWKIEFYPLPGKAETGHPTVEVPKDGRPDAETLLLTVRVPVTSQPVDADQIGGVLGFHDGDKAAGWSIPAPARPVAEATPAPVSKTAAPPSASAQIRGGGGGEVAGAGTLWHFLFFGLIGGLILNVMPCVLPVISLKVFSFIKQADEAPERIFKLGLAYAAGVFAWFLGFAALVVVLKSTGREVGYAFHLQNPWFVVGLGAAVFVFALNLLGVFEFILPGAAAGVLTQASQRGEGYSGAFFQGMLATVLGSACTAPFFGAALGFAFAQSAPVIFAMFAAIALGMSLPFVLLTAFPAWLRFLPRPGAWMERVKQATGFLMLATLLWLLSILGAMKGAEAVVWMGVLLLVLGVVCWVQGTFNTLVASVRTRGLAWAVMCVVLLAGGWLSVRQISAAQLPAAASGAIFSERLQAALKSDQPVFVDFTADWCVNCKVNERVVLSTQPVQDALKSSNAVFLTADWTVGAPDITALLRKFGRAGVPLYVIYPADRSREPIVLPELLTRQLVLDGLKSAAASKEPAVALNEVGH